MSPKEYWIEVIANSAEECGASLTNEQIDAIAESAQLGHEHYDMAFYSPPASDQYSAQEREWKAKYDALKADFDKYRGNAECAVRQALRRTHDARVSIGERGEVYEYGGRTERIQ